jgi:hypothetical protein
MAKKVHRIICENAYEKMWDTYVYFESEPTTKAYLEDLYHRQGLVESNRLAFQNTPKFIYFIKQSREYFNAAKQSHILVKPLLVYYGMMSLIKSVVLTMDPHYPNNTSVLRHGITTRKIKKLDYIFHEDEIKIQKEGLMPHFYQLLTGKEHWPNNKYKVKDLLSLIPDLHESFYRSFGSASIVPLFIAGQRDLTTGNTVCYIPINVLQSQQKTKEELLSWINGSNEGDAYFLLGGKESPHGLMEIQWNHPDYLHVFDCPNGFSNPLFPQDYKGSHYLYMEENKSLLPEVIVHYLLMYNLGMLCRYETELWGEIIFSFSSSDMFMVNEFINVAMRKFPNLILNMLFDEVLIFNHF